VKPKDAYVILGINYAHNSSAALLVGGEIVAACQEERFSRIKNQIGFPLKSIEFCLKEAKLESKDIDEIVVCGRLQLPFYLSISRNLKEKPGKELVEIGDIFHFFRYRILHTLAYYFPFLQDVDYFLTWFIDHFVGPFIRKKMKDDLSKRLNVGKEKITFVDHHSAHAAFAYYSSGYADTAKNTLVFCADGGGDEVCASIWLARKRKLKRISVTSIVNSIAYIYMYTTLYLGLTPVEDEYKVMGLAPYGKGKLVQRLFNKLDEFVFVDKKTFAFKTNVNTNLFYKYLNKIFYQERFDSIAGAVQKLVEVKVSEWVKIVVDHYRVDTVAFGGGLFANVKLNQRIASLPSIKQVFFAPSPGDESNCIGACYLRYKELISGGSVKPLRDLFLGPGIGEDDLESALEAAKRKGFRVEKIGDINQKVADLLASGEIVARMRGSVEFGTRALGNRSILADPSRLEVKDFLNKAIKSRDFWMPFAPSIMEGKIDNYLINPKHFRSPFMMMSFDTTEQGGKDLASAIHPYDKTARAQFVSKKENFDYWDLLLKFGEKTGRWGILNTSFNLHGEPIVLTAKDALATFANSGLRFLQIEDYLVEKR